MKPSIRNRWNLLFTSLLVLATPSAMAFREPPGTELVNFDKRAPTAAAAIEERSAGVHLLRARLAEVRIDFDERLGTPKWITAANGLLTGPGGSGKAISVETAAAFGANDPHRVTKAFLQEHAALFGYGPEILGSARVAQDSITTHNSLRTVVWQQELDGVTVFEALLIAHTTKREELVNISSQFVPLAEAAAEAGTGGRAALLSAPSISAAEAVAASVNNLGEELDAGGVSAVEPQAEGPEQRRHYRAEPLMGEADTKLVWLPMSQKSMRLCWQVVLFLRSRNEMYRLLVDTQSGEVLVRHRLTEYLSDASYRVFTSDSPTPFSPGCPTPCTTQPAVAGRTLVTFSAINTNASPNGWINDGNNETLGNNVDAHTDRDNNNLADLPRPQGSPFRVFDFPLSLTQEPLSYTNASVVQLFYWNNWIHDKLYELGFTESARNFQTLNFGRGGLGNDAVLADAQDGGGFNNANMSTPSDGSPGRMQMYLFNGPTPDRDGDLDAEIVLHEYTHGLSNRRVGGGVGLTALQSRGMGEGWSDWYGLALLSEAGDDPDGTYPQGGYATYLLDGLTANYYYGIRRYPYSTDMSKGPLMFKDIDPAQISSYPGIPRSPRVIFSPSEASAVHRQGEVWCQILWEVRANLVARHGHNVGNQLALQLVTDGMNLSPANPNFIQARDAILQADVVNNGGANLPQIWAGFAKRGMGASATSPASSTTSGVVQAFDVPDSLTVSPGTGFISSGAVGGPFTQTSKAFLLLNASTNAINWAGFRSASWLSLSPMNGTIVPGGTNGVLVSLDSSAYGLPVGIYSATVRFTNLTTGITQTRSFSLRVGQPDHFTELFDGGDNDLDNQTLTFTPDGSTNFYSVCREPATNFPTPPTGGISLGLSSHSFVALTTPTNISLYGRSTNVIYVASEGHLTLLAGDSSGTISLTNHFSRPRVSASLAHLHPNENGGSVTWLQLSNRVAITFNKVVEFGTVNTNSFQIELFYDGRIRMTHLAMATANGLVGLSAGNGLPAGFIESDLSSYGPCVLPLSFSVPATATEGNGVLAGQGQLTLPTPATSNLVVTLASSDTTEASVPASVTIPAGASGTNFDITIHDDAILDGPQPVTLSASTPGYAQGSGVLVVGDNESATLNVSLPASTTEGSAGVQGIVGCSAAPAANITVSLASSDTSEIQVPASIILPAGQTSAVFNLTVVNDTLIDGAQSALITAQVPNWTSGQGTIVVQDNEPTNLVVLLPASAREDNGVLFEAGSVRIGGTLSTNLNVSLLSSDTTELNVPATATILAGQTLGSFNLTIENDADIDGLQLATVTASAVGFSSGATNMIVYDDESPPAPSSPSPADLATNVIQTADLAWASGATGGEVISNEVYFGTNPVPGPAEWVGTTLGTSWVLPNLLPQTTYYWQVVARKTGLTPGPVWQFTTRGVDHFTWDPVASPKYVSEPFGVTLRAKDVFDGTVSNFSGTVNLSASGPGGLVTNRILGNISHSTSSSGTYTLGYSFTPSTNLTVTHVRSYSGASVSLWTDTGVLLASQAVSGPSGSWTETPLSTPVPLTAGTRYRVGFYTGGGIYYYRTDGSNFFANGTIDQSYYAASNAFPNLSTTTQWWLVDLLYTVGSPLSIPINPTVAGSFVNGVWSGNLAVLAPLTNLTLRADDGSGHTGVSVPFAVQLQNDIALTVNDSPDPVSLGAKLNYMISVTNIGPAAATGVVLSNVLAPNLTLVSVITSQGTIITTENLVLCQLGSLPANGSATITLAATAAAVGAITNLATVWRAEADAYAANNSAMTLTTVQTPQLRIHDVSRFEGHSGSAPATFSVSISPPPALPVTVLYATASGSAVAGQDFVATNGVLAFAPGETNQNVVVLINGDTLYETNEIFVVNLSAATNVTLADSQGIGTILNDDAIPTLSLADVALTEGNLGTSNAVFTLTLSAPCGLDVSFSYTTLDGNAFYPGDYAYRSGFLTLPAGVTSTNLVVVVNGDGLIEPDEVFYMQLYGAVNANLLKREAYCFILNDDGLPGQLDHFVWGAIGTTQHVGVPFNVTLTALDVFENVATVYSGPANLSASGNSVGSFNILGSLPPTSSSSGNYTLGHSFTPNTNLTVTHVRSYFGSKVSIWTDTGALLRSQAVNGAAGVWTETALAAPLTLNAGTRYRVGVYIGGGNYYWRTDGSNNFTHGTLHTSYDTSGDAFPTTTDSARWWLVDLRYATGTSTNALISPSLTGFFSNGVWNGNVTVLAEGQGLLLAANDGFGHNGFSAPLTVLLRDDLSLTVTDSPDPVWLGSNLVYTLTAANSGPGAATAVVISNLLPASVNFLSATPSQGNCTESNGMVVCNLGTVPGGSSAVVTLQVQPMAIDWITNRATIHRGEADSFLANNTTTNATRVRNPFAARVAIYGAPNTDSWNLDVSNKIAAASSFTAVDAYLVKSGYPVPTLAELQQYDSVLVYSDSSFNDSTALGNVLADYVDGGGGLVLSTFAFNNQLGRLGPGNYLPFNLVASSSSGSGLTLVANEVSHPILEEVLGFNGGSSSYHNLLSLTGGSLVASWSNGRPLVGARQLASGRTVGLNFFPPSSTVRSDFWLESTQGGRLMANALLWAAGISTQIPNDLSLKLGPLQSIVAVGSNLTYNLTISNSGPATATAVKLTNQLPASILLVGVTPSQGTWATNGNTVVCDLGTIAGGAAATVAIIGAVTAPGNLTNYAVLGRGELDTFPANNSVLTVTTAQAPALSINSLSFSEGNAGSNLVTFTVSLSIPSATNITVNFSSANGSALAGSDYLGTNGVLSFAPGATNRAVQVYILGDTNIEPNETFTVQLSSPVNATLSLASGTGTIINDDTVSTSPTTTLAQGNLILTLHNASAGINSLLFSGNEIYRVGTYISDWGLQLGSNAATFTRNANAGPVVGQPMTLTFADSRTASYIGAYMLGGADVTLTRDYSLVPGANLLRITMTMRNNGGTPLTLRCFETFDVDWMPAGGSSFYDTANDRYVLTTNGNAMQVGRSVLSTGGNLAVALGTTDSNALLSAVSSTYFAIDSSSALNTFFNTGGADSGGTVRDAALDIGREYVLAPGNTVSLAYYQSIASTLAQAEFALLSQLANPPLRFLQWQFSGGALQLVLGTTDGSPISAERAARITCYSTTNLIQATNIWVPLPASAVLSNGTLRISYPAYTNSPRQFFRAFESAN